MDSTWFFRELNLLYLQIYRNYSKLNIENKNTLKASALNIAGSHLYSSCHLQRVRSFNMCGQTLCLVNKTAQGTTIPKKLNSNPGSSPLVLNSSTCRTANSPFVSVPVLSRPAALMEGLGLMLIDGFAHGQCTKISGWAPRWACKQLDNARHVQSCTDHAHAGIQVCTSRYAGTRSYHHPVRSLWCSLILSVLAYGVVVQSSYVPWQWQ